MNHIPTYALYGETDAVILDQWLHCESIAARSALFDWEIGLHRHETFLQILYLTAGEGVCLLEASELELKPFALLTMPPRTVHGFRFSRDVEGHVITLRAEELDRLLARADGLKAVLQTPRVFSGADEAMARGLIQPLETIINEYPRAEAGRMAMIEASLTLVLTQMARACQEEGENYAGGDASGARHALRFREALDEHFRTQRGLAFYADRLGVSETHLNRIARTHFGASALGFINRRVVLEAARDLTFTAMSVKEIAFSLGFDDPAYFTRFFTKNAGRSPMAFRKGQRSLTP